MIRYYYRSIRDKKILKRDDLKKGTWIFAYDLQGDEFQDLVQKGFDEEILEDALDYFEVPRFEIEDGVAYFFTRYLVHRKDGEMSTAPILFALSDEYLLTVSHEKPEFLDHFAHGRGEIITTQKIKTLLIFLDALIHQYNRSLIKIRRAILRYYSDIQNISEEDIKKIVAIESKLADYLGALGPTVDSISTMLRGKQKMKLYEEDIEIVEDLHQDIEQVIASAKSILNIVQNVRSAHSDILAHKLNVTMKTLTAVTIIFTIPTIVSGIFGMNTWLPFQNGPLGFIFVMFIILSLSYFTYQFFQKNHWL